MTHSMRLRIPTLN
ncbi:erythromycin resistance leader peptide [Clostridium sp. MSJ-11]|uniref:Erythromycin resistance leader peptide n=1 Tax=Clostridium mobile TaxID=2841512 RepID=A0ABS6EH58_9CLOT|nr:erythromycin resistance leader peptide [Clostridium mobile]